MFSEAMHTWASAIDDHELSWVKAPATLSIQIDLMIWDKKKSNKSLKFPFSFLCRVLLTVYRILEVCIVSRTPFKWRLKLFTVWIQPCLCFVTIQTVIFILKQKVGRCGFSHMRLETCKPWSWSSQSSHCGQNQNCLANKHCFVSPLSITFHGLVTNQALQYATRYSNL